ncbi:hypothetical protein E3O45_12720 [Cryobacterium sp. TMS1-20-1]|uniref:hypothetical protein n=1 Tax=Cryobacterium sp. TMS1-20-1 TaxID=1259223 RepID=UPI00106DA0AF|nr:hypothetical protein [Cryobacterium sp. TMS1-20-1]TFC72408.1 hypothetical protein E3O45_12720 [Cryobacterium sp. TMS1-20-1]
MPNQPFATDPSPRRTMRQRIAGREFYFYLLVGAVTIFVTWMAYDLWKINWYIPINYEGDAVLIASHIKTDIETGWYESQSLLGAPFGQVYHDWKSADNLHHIFASVMGTFIHSFGVVMNLYFLLGFPLAALTAAWFLRLIGVSRAIALALAVLYAIAPYHFIRGENHMWLSAYYPIPLALGVVYLIARGRPIWRADNSPTRLVSWFTGPAAFTVFALALVGTANSYYAFWIVLFIGVAGLFQLINGRRWRSFVGAVAAGVFTVLVMLANMLPDIIYSWQNGANDAAVVRYPVEAELYALKIAQLILPQPGHRIPWLNELRTYYEGTYPFPAEQPALGFVATFGFIVALVLTLYAVLTWNRGRTAGRHSELLAALGVISALTMFGLLLATLGGFSTLVSFFTSDLRGWNRMSIVLAMLSLGVTGLVIDLALRSLDQRVSLRTGLLPTISAATAVLLLGGGYLDQVAPSRVPNYSATKAAFDQDEAMVKAIETIVPGEAMIFQLPYRKFPETPPPRNNVWDTDQLKPYLHSDTLRWSGGGIKGRPTSEWSGIAAAELTVSQLATVATFAGFAGILVDQNSYEPDDAAATVNSLTETLGSPVYQSPEGRYVFFTTVSVTAGLAGTTSEENAKLGAWMVTPVLATFQPDASQGYSAPLLGSTYEPGFTLDNPRDKPVDIALTFHLSYRQGDATLRFTYPDGSTTELQTGVESKSVTLNVTVPPGRSKIPLAVRDGAAPLSPVGGDSGPIQVGNIRATDLELMKAVEVVVPTLTTVQ